MQKFDPYINVDPGTMSPYQHGEVFVTDDGGETDLDLGPLRALHEHRHDARTRTGRPARSTRASSRRSAAATISGAPCRSFRTSPTRSRTRSAPCRDDVDVVLVEIGGTVGDIESLPFLEAIRQFRQDVGRDNSLYVHLTLVPFIGAAGELKTKPTQHSVRDLRSIGIQPDILLCRTDRFLDADIKRKIALFCDVDEEAVITAKDVVDDLRSAGRPRRRRARSDRPEVPAPAADRAAHAGVGGSRSTGSRTRSTKSPSTSSASTSATRIPTRASTRRSTTAASRTALKVNIKWIEAEALEEPNGAGAARRRRRHSRPGRLRQSRHARDDARRAGRARAADSLLRHLLRLPVGDRRVRAQRRRPRRRRLDRVQSRHAGEGDLQAARSARRRRPRRHDAPRQLRVRADAGLARAARLRREPRFTSGIVTATSSTACTSGR